MVAAAVPAEVLHCYGLRDGTVTPITAGHINATYLCDHRGTRVIVQKVNPIFGAEVHEDIEAVTQHLHAKGLTTPLLVRTIKGELFVRDGESVWRVLSYVAGTSYEKATSPALCESAAFLLGRTHTALADLRHDFKNKRGNIHDTPRHLNKLQRVLTSQATHERFAEVEPVATQILQRAGALASLADLPKRVVHGDPKISNVIFDAHEQALCLVDLDTLFPANLAVELGDALRSWCNPLTEDDLAAHVDLRYFAAAVRGYLRGGKGLVTRAEADAIVTGVETIALELAARFATDALEESYFGWDRARFSRALEHNLARAKGQLAVAVSMATQRQAASQLVRDAFSGA